MKIAIVQNTHGDEISGLSFPSFVDVFVGNPQAKESGVRFIESDLNRSFNGEIHTREERRACALKIMLKNYDFVLDIHSTVSGETDAVISTHNSPLERRLARRLTAKNYVHFPQMTESLIHHVKNGLALELSGHTNKERYQRAIDNFMLYLGGGDSDEEDLRYWNCIGSEKKSAGYVSTLGNYADVKKGEGFARKGGRVITAKEDFTTFLWNETAYDDIFGFKLVKT